MCSQSLQENRPVTLSVVLSFWNEAEVLEELTSRLHRVLDEECQKGTIHSYELIFVNDASTDNSEPILRELAQVHRDIKIVAMSRKFGVSPCVLAGMECASGEALIYMDADLQDPPEVIPKMLQAWRNLDDVDIVHTVRTKRLGESAIKLWITRIGYTILRGMSDINLLTEAGDFKLLSRRAVNELIKFKEKNPFLRGMVTWIGFNQVSIYYQREARYAGATKFPIFSRKVIRNFFNSALISFSDLPLQAISWLGLIVSICAFVYSAYVILEKVRGHNIPGWTAIMVTMLFLGGVELLAIGVLGLYINSIFVESKQRPNYIIKDKFGF